MNLGRYAVDLNCALHDVVIRESLEEMAFFTCEITSLDSEFVPYVADEPRVYMVGERIVGVYLVRDSISVSDESGESQLDLDVALAVRTSSHVFTFSRGAWFDEEISVNISDEEIVIPYTVDNCNADWTGNFSEGEAIAKTTRSTIRLA